MKKVAVLLPVYRFDKKEYVRLSINSMLTQTYKGELHVFIGVDGFVDDELAGQIKEYENDERVTISWFEENRGLAVVLNDLLDICHNQGYEYIARMDADDISLPNRIQLQMVFLNEHPEIDVVGGGIEEIDENGDSRDKTIVYPESPEECRHFFSKRNPHAHPAVLFRWSFFEKAGCKYRPEYRQNQDTMLWLDGMCHNTKHANIPEVILKYRMTDVMFKKRRNGWAFAKKQFTDRLIINRALGYGLMADAYGFAMFCLLISPAWLKKIAYRTLR